MQNESKHLSSIPGVDIGGSFTGIVYYIPPLTADSIGQLIVHKVPSTPKNPAQGLLYGMQDLDVARECVIIYGSTVATNAYSKHQYSRRWGLLIERAGEQV
jgi:N-methylhydantoinase A/oxoprolinase/acetone carboxylase beta subunit